MGRTQTFDTNEVVRAARAVFWEHGYESAALPDLEKATGLSRSSIYHAFGSKRGLFDAAVASYLDEVVRPPLRQLAHDDATPDALDRYLLGLRDALQHAGSGAGMNGCLLISAANAPIARDDTVARTIDAYAAELRTAVVSGIARQLPDLPAGQRDTLATACAGLVIAALSLVRVNLTAAVASLDAARDLVRSHERAAQPREPAPLG